MLNLRKDTAHIATWTCHEEGTRRRVWWDFREFSSFRSSTNLESFIGYILGIENLNDRLKRIFFQIQLRLFATIMIIESEPSYLFFFLLLFVIFFVIPFSFNFFTHAID